MIQEILEAEEMVQTTRFNQKALLAALLMAQASPEAHQAQIAQIESVMEKDDIESVRERIEQWQAVAK
jgi:type IV secretory pathway VirB4 component